MPSPSLSRVTRAYVSGSNRSRVVVGQVRRQEKREVIADFTGLLPAADPIASVTWRCDSPWVAYMSDAEVDGRVTSVTVDFQNGGRANLKATITTDGGSVYSQVYQYTVRDCPMFNEDPVTTSGPYSLTATAA